MIKKAFEYIKSMSKAYLIFNAGVLIGVVFGAAVATTLTLAVVGAPDAEALQVLLEAQGATVSEPAETEITNHCED